MFVENVTEKATVQQQESSASNDRDWEAWRQHWSLRPGVAYLNHGSFGPPPREVIAARAAWLERLQSEPVDFLTRQLGPAQDEARSCLARFVGVAAADLIFTDNATTAMNIVAASFRLEAGDEVLATDHEYGAVLRMWQRRCEQRGARLVVRPLPCPMHTEEEVVEALFAGATTRTRLLVFSHVTSPTAIVLPATAICRRARRLGLSVCIDGSHAIAMRPLSITELNCDYYAASCHKWLCAPFGSGFLYAHPRAQASVEPLVVSWGPGAGEPATWQSEFNWPGTRDFTSWLTIPAAVAFLESVGLDAFRERTHALARLAREQIGDVTGLEPLVPDSPAWYGSMISLPLPDGPSNPLREALWDQYRIEAPIIDWQGRRLIRPCCHLHTTPADVERLAAALRRLLAK